MKTDKAYHEARRMLVALLDQPDDGEVTGLDNISKPDRVNMMVTCSARVIVHVLCTVSDYRSDIANEGLTRLIEDMRRNIGKICGNH